MDTAKTRLHLILTALLGLSLLLVTGACAPAEEPPGEVPAAEDGAAAPSDAEDAPAEGTTAIGEAVMGPIAVGSKDFTEAVILGEMYALALEDAGFEVERKLNLGATDIAHAALLAGDIDLYPEYTSTALLNVLQREPLQDPQEVYDTVAEAYRAQYDLVWLAPAPFNNPQAMATRHDVAEAHGTTYTEISAAAPELVLGGPPEFFERADGLPGLRGAYGGFEFAETVQLDAGLRYPALVNGDVDVVVAFGTDGQISGLDLVLLEDDQNFFPSYQVAPVVRADTLEAMPGIQPVLDEVNAPLTNEVMQRLNWSVDGPEGLEPAEVAAAFLREQGLIE
jgi:osmoprotectant transport system substrate-binding protein